MPSIFRLEWVGHLHSSSPICNGFLRFTSGETPADSQHGSQPRLFHLLVQTLVGLKPGIECAAQCMQTYYKMSYATTLYQMINLTKHQMVLEKQHVINTFCLAAFKYLCISDQTILQFYNFIVQQQIWIDTQSVTPMSRDPLRVRRSAVNDAFFSVTLIPALPSLYPSSHHHVQPTMTNSR